MVVLLINILLFLFWVLLLDTIVTIFTWFLVMFLVVLRLLYSHIPSLICALYTYLNKKHELAVFSKAGW